MISGLDLSQTTNYTLKNDNEPKTVWKLGILPGYLYTRILVDIEGTERAYKLLQVGLKGWEGFGSVNYETVKEKLFGREIEVVPMSVLDRIPIAIVGELSAKIIEINQVSDAEKKI